MGQPDTPQIIGTVTCCPYLVPGKGIPVSGRLSTSKMVIISHRDAVGFILSK